MKKTIPFSLKSIIQLLILFFFSTTLPAQVKINSFSPASGPVGTTVTINGNYFNPKADSNIVYFGGVRAKVSAATSSSLTVIVPKSTTYEPISVLNTSTRQITSSYQPFVTTFNIGATSTTVINASQTPAVNYSTDYFPSDVHAADLDGDGRPDLVVNTGGAVDVFRNTTVPGSFNTTSFAPMTNYWNGDGAWNVSLRDLDGDGRLDMLCASSGNTFHVRIYMNLSTPGHIAFGAAQTFAMSNGPVEAVDIDGDGKLDLVSAAQGGVSLWLNTTAAAGSLSFANPVTYGLAGNVSDMVVSDIDGDGKPDIVTANGSDRTLSVLRNTARLGVINDSSLAPYFLVTLLKPASHLTIGDLDGDNKPDLAISTDSGVAILKNQATPGALSTASFAAEVDFHTGSWISGVTMGDVDGDGKPDLVISNFVGYGRGYTSILKNITSPGSITSASFAPRSDVYDVGLPNGVAISDLDQDGRPELIVTNGDNMQGSLSILRPVINSLPPVITGISPDSATIGLTVTIRGRYLSGVSGVTLGNIPVTSFSGLSDTSITARVSNGATGNISVTTSLGTGTLGGFTFVSSPSITAFTPAAAGRGDTVIISGSRFTDADTLSFGGVAPSWFTVVSDNTIKALIGSTGASGNLIVKTPFGVDTVPGFTYINYPLVSSFSPIGGATGDTITIQGTNFSTATSVSFGGSPAAAFTIVSNTVIKAKVGAGATGKITVTTPAGSNSLEEFTYVYSAPVISSFSPASGPAGTAVTITGSGFDPVAANNIVYFGGVKAAVTQAGNGSLTVIAPVGATYQPLSVTTHQKTAYSYIPFDLTFSGGGAITSTSFAAPATISSGNGGSTLALADADGDGKLDLATSVNYTVSLLRNTSTGGQLGFAAPVSASSPTGISPQAIYPVDLDGDGRLDFVTGYSDGYPALAYANTSTRGKLAINGGLTWRGQSLDQCFIATGDFNGDGRPDIAATSLYSSLLNIMTNTTLNSALAFSNSANYGVDYRPNGTIVNDFDGDGKPDVIVEDWYTSKITIFKNTTTTSTITFGPRADISQPGGMNFMTSADIDGDRKPDLIISLASNNIAVYRNISSGGVISFAAPVLIPLTGNPGYLAIGDLDGDGKPDVAAAVPSLNILSILHNTSSTGAIAFADTADLATGSSASMLAIGDLNGDGKPDIVLNTGGSQAVFLNQINSTATPTLTAFTPASAAQGSVVTLTGNNFTGTTSVSFGGVPASAFTIVSNTTITATVGQGATGTISVTTPNGTAGKDSFTYIYPAPAITAFTPTQAAAGTMVTISGTNLDGVTSVSFGGVPATSFSIVTPGTITAVVGAAASGSVAVTSSAGTGSLGGFTFIPPPPVISSSAPANGGPGTTVTITGSGFTGTTAVSFGGTPATSFTVTSPTTITAVVGSGTTGNIYVTNPQGTAAASWFVFVAPTPTISSITPLSAPPGTVITIIGTNLTGANALTFGGVAAASFTVVSPDTIRAVVGQGATGWVYVTTPYGTAGSPSQFTLTTPVATLTSFSPAMGTAGTTITITGTHLSNVTGVSFGGTAAASFSVYSDNAITAIVGSGATGNIVVSTSNGPDTLTGFIYNAPPPTLQSIYPTSARQGDPVTLFGANLLGATSVTFGGVPAASFTISSDYQISAVVGNGASGNVVVTTATGTATVSGFVFVPPVPQMTSFSPQTGTGGTLITIKGKYLTGASFVQIGQWYAQSVTVVSDSVVTALVNYNGSSGAVQVTTPGGSVSLDGFTFVASGVPVITSISPISGTAGTVDTITGLNLSNVTSVAFGGTPAASITILSPTMIIAVVGQGSSGAVAVLTTTGASTSFNGFTYTTTTTTPPSTPTHITSFSPASGTTGTSVTIRGVGFTGTTLVSFGPTAAQSFTILSDSTITAIIGTGSSGQVFVSGSQGLDSLAGFTYTTTTTTTPTPPTFKLLSFTGTIAANQPVLTWKIVDELSISYYVVEYSTDSSGFSAAASLTALSKDTGTHTYTYTDPAPRNDVIYYRLKIEDTAGNYTYSNVIAVHVAGLLSTLSVYPNPANGFISVAVPNAAVASRFQLTDMMGKISRSVQVAQNVTTVKIDITALTEGVYKLIWSDGVNYSYQTILILR